MPVFLAWSLWWTYVQVEAEAFLWKSRRCLSHFFFFIELFWKLSLNDQIKLFKYACVTLKYLFCLILSNAIVALIRIWNYERKSW